MITFSDIKVEIEDYDATFEGENEVSEGLALVMDAFKGFFKEEFANVLVRRFSKSVEHTANSMIIRD